MPHGVSSYYKQSLDSTLKIEFIEIGENQSKSKNQRTADYLAALYKLNGTDKMQVISEDNKN